MSEAPSGEWRPASRYPDPSVISLDPRFDKYMLPLAAVERLATGCRWSEGPVWFGDGRYLLWSDIPNNRIMRWDECFRSGLGLSGKPSNFSNGQTRDRQGRLVTLRAWRAAAMTRTEYDGTITVLIDSFRRATPLNSPNDVVVKSDGIGLVHRSDRSAFWGIMRDGHRSDPELGSARLSASTPRPARPVVDRRMTSLGPNGLAFSPDERKLYIVESRVRQPNRKILEYDVSDDGRGPRSAASGF